MDLTALRTLKLAVELGSYQRAAEVQNYAKSTVTFQIRQLEKELGVTLFEKNDRKMTPTKDCLKVLPLAQRLLDDADELKRLCSDSEDLKGSLALAVPESLITYQLQPVLRIFKRQAPEVNLKIHVMNCFDIYDEMIHHGQYDLAIHYDVGTYPERMAKIPIGTFPLALAASPELDKDERDFITPDQHKNVCHISNDAKALYMKYWNAYLTEKRILLQPEMELWSIESVKQCVKSNLGVAVLPEFTIAEELRKGELILLETQMKNQSLTAVCIYNRTSHLLPPARLFLEDLMQMTTG